MTPLTRIDDLRTEATAELRAARSLAELRAAKARYLGREAELSSLLRSIRTLPESQREHVGTAANRLKLKLEREFARRGEVLEGDELQHELESSRVDLTLPGLAVPRPGRLHVLTQVRREIEDVFLGLGFSIWEGPEVEDVYYNFDALNHAPEHPARMRDQTFYVTEDVVLRTHTSPMQVRAMQSESPPLFIIVPGRVYRRDDDLTHTPEFHQVEGLAVAEDITLADLKGTLEEFARQLFGEDREILVRGHFFPFTEPSIEVDVSCGACTDGYDRAGTCRVCKGSGWIEILGAGEVDPNVFRAVGTPAYDPEKVQGFAWGMGVERIALLKHGFDRLRRCYENDLRFLEQFG
jgi:phenylalanyl-tRNA synthetase alpha chain